VSAGFNVIIISFYLAGGSTADMAQAWAGLDAGTKQSTIQTAHNAGAVVTVSLGGSTDSPFSVDPYSAGQQAAKWAQANYLDGVDFDIENLAIGFRGGSLSAIDTVYWLGNVTKGAYDVLGSGGIISHAPQAPYFGPAGNSALWTGTTGGYTSVYWLVPDYITYFNLQFYNQGADCYTDYNGLFLSSCSVFPLTSLMEIANYTKIPLSKLVVGKPVTTADASNGWVDPNTLHGYFQQAQSQLGWNAGVMGWVWNDPATLQSWIQAIYGSGGSNGGANGGSLSGGSNSGPASSSSSSSNSGSGSSSSNSGSSSGGYSCGSRPTGMYCVNSTAFEWCPQGIIQSCAPGTTCDQSGNSINCD